MIFILYYLSQKKEMSKRNLIIVVVLLVSMRSTAQTAMTLKQCVETGIANNFDVLQRQLQAQSDEANWKQSRF